MLESANVMGAVRNLSIYTVGIALAVAGALGLAEAIELAFVPAVAGFVVGITLVVAVHEFLGGPV